MIGTRISWASSLRCLRLGPITAGQDRTVRATIQKNCIEMHSQLVDTGARRVGDVLALCLIGGRTPISRRMDVVVARVENARRQRRRRLQRLAVVAGILFEERLGQRHRQRLRWDVEVDHLVHEGRFADTYRFTLEAFEALHTMLLPKLAVTSGRWSGASGISTRNRLQLFLRYLAGGVAADIYRFSGISRSSFYRIVDDVATAIVTEPSLAIRFPASSTEREKAVAAFTTKSEDAIFSGCTGAMDGWLCAIDSPRESENDGAGSRAYYSGHYCRYGINVQACCDAECRFLWVSASCPGGMNDARAYRSSSFVSVVESLERGLYVVADNAYIATNHLLTPFTRTEIEDKYMDSYNFRLSQLRIRIEMAFGLLVAKWRLFRRPLECKLQSATRLILAATMLHNFAINWRLSHGASKNVAQEEYNAIRAAEQEGIASILAYTPSSVAPAPANGVHSYVRDMLVEKIRAAGLLRPAR